MPNCVDISCYNPTPDFARLREAGITTVILRTIRKGLVVDEAFERFYAGATSAGMRVGAYLYTYATSKSYAKKEADKLIQLLNGRPMPAGIWFDMEIPDLRSASAETVQGIADAFRGKLRAAGYQSGIYCDADFYKEENHFKGYDSSCPFWIASYGKNDGKQHTKPSIAHPLWAWQYSDRGSVPGISGQVDVSQVYGSGDLPLLVCDLPTIQRGAKSYAVQLLQLRLNAVEGFGLLVDGDFGPDTQMAVLEFQEARGLDADGIVGPVTWKLLLK